MNITVTGPRGGAMPFERSYFIKEATEFFAKSLGINRLKTKINVLVHEQLLIDGDTMGYCEAKSEREFDISLCSWGNWLSVLAHEMVHLYQMQVWKDPYSNHNSNFYSWRNYFKLHGLRLYQ